MEPVRYIRHLDDLATFWRFVDGGGGYSAPQLFAILVAPSGLVLPSITHMYDEQYAQAPPEELLERFVDAHVSALRDLGGGSLAVLKARPGGPSMTAADRAWCAGLHRHLQAAPCASYPVFFATDTRLGVVPPDELIASAA